MRAVTAEAESDPALGAGEEGNCPGTPSAMVWECRADAGDHPLHSPYTPSVPKTYTWGNHHEDTYT